MRKMVQSSKSINHSVSPRWRGSALHLFTRKGKLVIEVQVRGGNLEKAMRVLKKKVQKEGIVKEIKRRQFYMKPSEVKLPPSSYAAKRLCI